MEAKNSGQSINVLRDVWLFDPVKPFKDVFLFQEYPKSLCIQIVNFSTNPITYLKVIAIYIFGHLI